MPEHNLRDRIVALRRVRASELVANPRNPRTHPKEQRALLADILQSIGFAGAELTVTLPVRLMLLDGHARAELVGDALVPCLETDLTLEEADAVLASFDALERMATYDPHTAAALTAALTLPYQDMGRLLTVAAAQDAGLDLLRQLEAERVAQTRLLAAGSYVDAEIADDRALNRFYDDDDETEEEDAEEEDAERPHGPVGVPAVVARPTLLSRFPVTPSSVLDGRTEAWAERRAAWVGHEVITTYDPVLTEALIRWWSAPDATVGDLAPNGDHATIVNLAGRTYALPAEDATLAETVGTRLATLTRQPLASWMATLYAVCVDEAALTTQAPRIVWPEELWPYLELLCLAHAMQPVTLRIAPGLIKPERERRQEPNTCLLLFSGGKDSTAAGLLAQQAGQHVHAVYVRRINQVYASTEERGAIEAARVLGWPLTIVEPPILPKADSETLCKNQYALAQALAGVDFVPGSYATGMYALDDCDLVAWFHDMGVAATSFDAVLRACDPQSPQMRPLLAHMEEAVRVWATLGGPEVMEACTTCMMPRYNKPQHRRRVEAMGVVPFSSYACGACSKCLSTHYLLMQLDPEHYHYPPEYLASVFAKLREDYKQPSWCHGHARLRSIPPKARARRPGGSTAYTFDVLLNGSLALDARVNQFAPVSVRSERVTRPQAGLTVAPPSVDLLLADLATAPLDTLAPALERLAPDHFACLVLTPQTAGAARTLCGVAGLRPYTEAVYLRPTLSADDFTQTRRLPLGHSHVEVWCKGDPEIALAACGPLPEWESVHGDRD